MTARVSCCAWITWVFRAVFFLGAAYRGVRPPPSFLRVLPRGWLTHTAVSAFPPEKKCVFFSVLDETRVFCCNPVKALRPRTSRSWCVAGGAESVSLAGSGAPPRGAGHVPPRRGVRQNRQQIPRPGSGRRRRRRRDFWRCFAHWLCFGRAGGVVVHIK